MIESSLSKTQIKNLGESFLRLLDQCHKYKSHHIGSAFSSLPIMLEIYSKMLASDRFILSSGHAAAALYVTLEKELNRDTSVLFEEMGEHPHRDRDWGIDCSTGSLGMGIAAAVGMAIANKKINVYCLVSDGECAEGVFWESIRFAKYMNLTNLYVYVNINGWAGYDSINKEELVKEITSVNNLIQIKLTSNYPFESFGLKAHYMNLSDSVYQQAKKRICEDYL
jgi:transketolase